MTGRPLNEYIYLDNAATTQVAPEVAELVSACMLADYGNPASAHHAGIAAEGRVKRARAQLLAALGDTGDVGEILWTSGGTESDALGVLGAAQARCGHGKHIVISAIEHSAVRECAAQLREQGWRVTRVPVDRNGWMSAEAVASALDPDTTVVATMLVNNEIGTILPVGEIARLVKERRPDVHVHTDAVQALGKIEIDVLQLGVDSVAVAAHKLHGPKGVGALWYRKDTRLSPLWSGGGHQGGLRSGTLNVPGIAGFGAAAELAVRDLRKHQEHWARLRRILVEAAGKSGVTTRENGAEAPRAPHVLSLAFCGIPAEPLLHVLESRGVLVSAGSACSERSRRPSHVLAAIGLDGEWGTLRLSFSRTTTTEQVETAAEALIDALRSF
jgi:cysteine desulfurase